MAKITKDQCVLCRREMKKLFLKGEKCLGPKCPVSKRPYVPGVHGLSRRSKPSDYAISFREKQKVKRIYGVLEKQFRNYFKKADKKEGVTGEILLQLLEMRLDNIVYRMGFAVSLRQARQLVGHGMFLVNGKKVNIPSYNAKVGDTVEVRDSDKKNKYFTEILPNQGEREVSPWLKVDIKKLKGEILAVPQREELDQEIKEQLIVELYSK